MTPSALSFCALALPMLLRMSSAQKPLVTKCWYEWIEGCRNNPGYRESIFGDFCWLYSTMTSLRYQAINCMIGIHAVVAYIWTLSKSPLSPEEIMCELRWHTAWQVCQGHARGCIQSAAAARRLAAAQHPEGCARGSPQRSGPGQVPARPAAASAPAWRQDSAAGSMPGRLQAAQAARQPPGHAQRRRAAQYRQQHA